MDTVRFYNDFNKLTEILPKDIVSFLNNITIDDIIEIVLDLGRNAEVRHSDGKTEYMESRLVTEEDLQETISKIQPFTHDNRSGIPGTLHRISAIRNRQGKVVGLSYGGKTYINMIRNIRESELERRFFSRLVELGVAVEIESNRR